jgi:hypothetical protein
MLRDSLEKSASKWVGEAAARRMRGVSIALPGQGSMRGGRSFRRVCGRRKEKQAEYREWHVGRFDARHILLSCGCPTTRGYGNSNVYQCG